MEKQMTDTKPEGWIDDLEVENAQIKWAFSHFAGEKDLYNEEGNHNFVIIVPTVQEAEALRAIGWNVKEKAPYEEGDDPEQHLEVKISDKYGLPKIYFIKGGRKYRVENKAELADIRRDVVTQIDVILQPSRWVNGARTGISAYVKEMYVTMKESRFDSKYASLDEVR
jgi:hypothetical protein